METPSENYYRPHLAKKSPVKNNIHWSTFLLNFYLCSIMCHIVAPFFQYCVWVGSNVGAGGGGCGAGVGVDNSDDVDNSCVVRAVVICGGVVKSGFSNFTAVAEGFVQSKAHSDLWKRLRWWNMFALDLNVVPQVAHEYNASPVCVAMCSYNTEKKSTTEQLNPSKTRGHTFKSCGLLKAFSQTLHLYFRIISWLNCMCFLSAVAVVETKPQMWQRCSTSLLLWIFRRCLYIDDALEYHLPQ